MKSEGRFICVCPPKALDLGGGAHRKSTDAQVADKLSQFHLNSQVWLSDGGGVAISTPGDDKRSMAHPETYVNDQLIVAFCGELTNLEELASKSLYEEVTDAGGLPEQNLSARVLGMLYAKLQDPEKVVAKLRGTFDFVIMDTTTVRIFAARDNSGGMPLYQGRLPDGTVVVSNYEPDGFHMETEVPAGHFVFGNRRCNLPQKFSPSLEDLQQARSQARAAASRALEGLLGAKRESPKVVNTPDRFTVVVSKAQKRKAKAAKAKADLPLSKPAAPHPQPVPRRASAIPKHSRKPSAPSGGSPGRADGSNWWRKAEPAPAPAPVPAPVRVTSGLNANAPVFKAAVRVAAATATPPPSPAPDRRECPQKEQIEEAVRALHKIASSGKIQKMLAQKAVGEEGAEVERTPSCSNLHRVESLKRVGSMQRVGSDLQSLLGQVN